MIRSLVAVALALGIPALQPDAGRVLADMRQALGGEAALAAVRAFSVSASESTEIDDRAMRSLGPDMSLAKARASGVSGGDSSTWNAIQMSVDVEWTSVLPDSSVRVRRMPSPSWGRGTVTTDGFRGDALIHRYESDTPAPLNPFQAATPADRAAAEAAAVRHWKREFSMLAIALIGLPTFDPLDISYDGQRSVAGRPCDLLQIRLSDDSTATLAVDASTHLPVSVSWMGPAGFLVATESIEYAPSGQAQPGTSPFPPPTTIAGTSAATVPGGQASGAGGPTAGASSMEYRILFDDFKVVDGLKWPHRFTTKVGDLFVQTTRVRKYKLNPKIDPKLFDPARR